MRNIKHIFLLLVMLIVVLPAQAQIRDGRVSYGETFDGEVVQEGVYSVVAFTGQAGDIVTVTVIAPPSATLDPLFYILYGDIWLAFNDDAESPVVDSFNSQVKDFVLPHDGTYDIYVGGYGGTGAFSVSVDYVGSIQEIDAYALSYGETLTGTLEADNNFYLSQFEATAGDEISVAMLTTSDVYLDTIFYLYDSEFFPLAVVDDNSQTEEGNYDAILDYYVLPATDTYYLLATRFEGSGSFSLSLDNYNATSGSVPTTPSSSTGSELAYDDFTTGFIDSTTTEIQYTFSGTEGDVVTITMVAEAGVDLDSVLKLIAPSGVTVAENDDAADLSLGRFNSQIADFVLPQTGTYTIVATRFSGAGNFTLSLDSVSGTASSSEEATLPQSDVLAYDVPAGWVTEDMDSVMLFASSDDVRLRARDGDTPTLTSGERVFVMIEMPLAGAPLDELFEGVKGMMNDSDTVYGNTFSSDASSSYDWLAVEAEGSKATGLLYGIDLGNDNTVFLQVLYGDDLEGTKQIIAEFIESIRYE